MKQLRLGTLIIGLLLLVAVQVNARDITAEHPQTRITEEQGAATELTFSAVGTCGENYGCAVTELPASESIDHDDLLAELASSLGQDDSISN